MQLLESVAETRAACRKARARGRLGLVPTMGALHAGHLSLVRQARAQCDAVAVSIFVNPLQFAASEDLNRYPRRMDEDRAMLAAEGVDLLFAPLVAEMYPPGGITTVDMGGLGEKLDGAGRPGHFRGVATVVTKLFNIVQPDAAYFGQKDAVQVAILRRMIKDLDFGIEMVACPTLRDPDGLAMSSRNAYLGSEERRVALAIPRALTAMQAMIAGGESVPTRVLGEGVRLLSAQAGLNIEYVQAVHPETLDRVAKIVPGTLVAVAAKVGPTRLIDNFLVS